MELYIIIALLIGIFTCEGSRLLLTHFWKPGKLDHFKGKLDGTRKVIWDLEFKKFKTREIREDIRREYDNKKQALHASEAAIANFPKEGDKAEKASLEDQVVILKRDIERHESQLRDIDAQIDGAKPSSDYPEGVMGISEEIDSMRQIEAMLVEWIDQN